VIDIFNTQKISKTHNIMLMWNIVQNNIITKDSSKTKNFMDKENIHPKNIIIKVNLKMINLMEQWKKYFLKKIQYI